MSVIVVESHSQERSFKSLPCQICTYFLQQNILSLAKPRFVFASAGTMTPKPRPKMYK